MGTEVRLVFFLHTFICLSPLVSKGVNISINQLLSVCGCGEREIVELSTRRRDCERARKRRRGGEGRLLKLCFHSLPTEACAAEQFGRQTRIHTHTVKTNVFTLFPFRSCDKKKESSILYLCKSRPGLDGSVCAVEFFCYHVRDSVGVVCVSFSPFRIATCKAKSGHASSQDPGTRDAFFCHLRSLLRAHNGTRLRTNALLTRPDVPLNLMADGVP